MVGALCENAQIDIAGGLVPEPVVPPLTSGSHSQEPIGSSVMSGCCLDPEPVNRPLKLGSLRQEPTGPSLITGGLDPEPVSPTLGNIAPNVSASTLTSDSSHTRSSSTMLTSRSVSPEKFSISPGNIIQDNLVRTKDMRPTTPILPGIPSSSYSHDKSSGTKLSLPSSNSSNKSTNSNTSLSKSKESSELSSCNPLSNNSVESSVKGIYRRPASKDSNRSDNSVLSRPASKCSNMSNASKLSVSRSNLDATLSLSSPTMNSNSVLSSDVAVASSSLSKFSQRNDSEFDQSRPASTHSNQSSDIMLSLRINSSGSTSQSSDCNSALCNDAKPSLRLTSDVHSSKISDESNLAVPSSRISSDKNSRKSLSSTKQKSRSSYHMLHALESDKAHDDSVRSESEIKTTEDNETMPTISDESNTSTIINFNDKHRFQSTDATKSDLSHENDNSEAATEARPNSVQLVVTESPVAFSEVTYPLPVITAKGQKVSMGTLRKMATSAARAGHSVLPNRTEARSAVTTQLRHPDSSLNANQFTKSDSKAQKGYLPAGKLPANNPTWHKNDGDMSEGPAQPDAGIKDHISMDLSHDELSSPENAPFLPSRGNINRTNALVSLNNMKSTGKETESRRARHSHPGSSTGPSHSDSGLRSSHPGPDLGIRSYNPDPGSNTRPATENPRLTYVKTPAPPRPSPSGENTSPPRPSPSPGTSTETPATQGRRVSESKEHEGSTIFV